MFVDYENFKPRFPVICHLCRKLICFKENYDTSEIWICKECEKKWESNNEAH